MTAYYVPDGRAKALLAIDIERDAQVAKWGDQQHPDLEPGRVVNGRDRFADMAFAHKAHNDRAAKDGTIDWTGILLEEVYEALAESNPVRLREELVQSAAVIVAWIEDIDSRDPHGEVFSWGNPLPVREF